VVDRPARRVFISHTPELREYPADTSFVAAAESAISRAGDAVMDFAVRERATAAESHGVVASAEVYVLVAGFRYGSPVRDRPGMSYVECEFESASVLGLPRLVFLVDEAAVGPAGLFRDLRFGIRQEAFRQRLMDGRLETRSVRSPAELADAVERALVDLPRFTAAEARPTLESLPAEARLLKDALHSLRELDGAISRHISEGDQAAVRQFVGIARTQALTVLELALARAALPPNSRSRFSRDGVAHAEQLLGIKPGTFTSFFLVNLDAGAERKKKALTELLTQVRDRIDSTPVDADLRTPPSWLPMVLRIGSAVLVGTFVGAPLAALAVGESVVKEIVKAGIAVTVAAIAVDVTNPALERWLRRPNPAKPIADPHPPLPRQSYITHQPHRYIYDVDDVDEPFDDFDSP
jgi:hypothetical protein